MSEIVTDEYEKHTNTLGGSYKCQRIIKIWKKERETIPSSYIIKSLHQELFSGSEEDYYKKGLIPSSPGSYRNEDIDISGLSHSKNHSMVFESVSGIDVSYAMGLYTNKLDAIMQSLPYSPVERSRSIIKDAAWAYYVFERIHPFLDGNGRIGKMILKTILSGAGFRDLIFHDDRWKKNGQSQHLEALHRVDITGNLHHLELFLLTNLVYRYSPEENHRKPYLYRELIDSVNQLKLEVKNAAFFLDITRAESMIENFLLQEKHTAL